VFLEAEPEYGKYGIPTVWNCHPRLIKVGQLLVGQHPF